MIKGTLAAAVERRSRFKEKEEVPTTTDPLF